MCAMTRMFCPEDGPVFVETDPKYYKDLRKRYSCRCGQCGLIVGDLEFVGVIPWVHHYYSEDDLDTLAERMEGYKVKH